MVGAIPTVFIFGAVLKILRFVKIFVMDTTMLKRRLHNYVENAEDKKLKAIYTMLEHEIEEDGVEYTELLKAELKKRVACYKENTASAVSAEESKKRILEILNAAG